MLRGLRVKADIRNPFRYLLITEQLLRSLSGAACTTPDTGKSSPHCLLLLAIEAWDLLDSVKKGPPFPGPNCQKKGDPFVIFLS